MKFDEVTTQFVLTKHVIAYDVMSIRSKIWDAMKPEQKVKFQAAADKMSDENIKRFDAQEAETLEYFKKEGKKVYTPDVACLPRLRAKEVRRKIRQGLAERRARAHHRDQVVALASRASGTGRFIQLEPAGSLAARFQSDAVEIDEVGALASSAAPRMSQSRCSA